jgi:putative copper export protein
MTTATLLSDLSKWLAATSLSHTIQTTTWIIPTLQTIHILCVAALFSSAVLVDLRIWRLTQRDVPLSDVARRFLPWIWPVVIVLLLTGSLLIVGEPRRSLLNDTFYIKMALLAFALVLTGLLQWSLTSAPGFWERDVGRRIVGRLAAVASILAWSGIIFAGRFIAYTQT